MFTVPVILENRNDYLDHDRLFKDLIKNFFEAFIEGFFPDLHPHMDFSTVKFLEQEVHMDLIAGKKKEIDILAEVKLNNQNQILLIHTEAQSTHESHFQERMYLYFNYLYAKYRKPIQPIAVLSYTREKEIPNQFTVETPIQKVLQFNFLQLHLANQNWKEYIQSNNPIAAALLSKMGYTKKERVQVKLEFLRMLSRMEINPAKMELLYGFFESYLQLNEEEEIQMKEKMTHLPTEEKEAVLHLPNSYFERGLVKGREEGKQVGKQEGIQEGKQVGKFEVARKLLSKGMPVEDIADVTELSVESIQNLINQ